jgi:hypothetical protein
MYFSPHLRPLAGLLREERRLGILVTTSLKLLAAVRRAARATRPLVWAARAVAEAVATRARTITHSAHLSHTQLEAPLAKAGLARQQLRAPQGGRQATPASPVTPWEGREALVRLATFYEVEVMAGRARRPVHLAPEAVEEAAPQVLAATAATAATRVQEAHLAP